MKPFHYWLTRQYDASAWVRLAVILAAVILSNLLIWPVMAMVDSDALKGVLSLSIIFGISAYLSVACTSRPEYNTVLSPFIHVDAKTDHAAVREAVQAAMGRIPHNYG